MSEPQKLVVEDVTLEEVKQGLADGSIALIDVREPNEWAVGHIKGAILNPLSTFDAQALPTDKRVVFQCRSGKRTLQAIALAQDAGRTDARAHFSGSMNAWERAGEPIAHD
jgi:rhodanese-related sulfurtransferase